MAGLPRPLDPAVLVGTETGDDAGVYRLDEGRALVVTADFITPVADDPYRFGEISAANALSDVFAMGGRPLAALALCAFPKLLNPEVAHEILAGGQEKAAEAGAQVVGGHTVRNEELFYGLSVTGLVHPARILRNSGARPGDALVLTKPLGTGLLINGRRKGLGEDRDLLAALESMALLSRGASEAALALGAHAATDVTGFGLSGHALGMARGCGVGVVLHADLLPILEGAAVLAAQGVTTGSTGHNRRNAAESLRAALPLPPVLDQLLHDPQTSGGLLVALPADRADAFVAAARASGAPGATRIGEVVGSETPFLELRGDLRRFE